MSSNLIAGSIEEWHRLQSVISIFSENHRLKSEPHKRNRDKDEQREI
jgi:hypothetical protein